MKIILSITLGFLAIFCHAENFLTAANCRFSGGSGSFADNQAVFTTDKQGVVYINNIPTPDVGRLYRVKIGFIADRGMRVRAYMENGTNWENSASPFVTADGSQQYITINFRLTKPVTKPSYAAINVNSKGTIRITEVTVTAGEIPTAGSVLFQENCSFSPRDAGRFEGHTPILTVKDDKTNAQIYIQKIATASVELTYNITIEFTATKGMRVFSYIENPDGWQNAPGPRPTATGERQTMRYSFRLRKAVSKPSYIVFQAQGIPGTATIHSVTVHATSPDAIHDADFSGNAQFWTLENGAKVIDDHGNKKLEISGNAVAFSPEFELQPNRSYRITYDVQGITAPGAASMFSEYKVQVLYRQLTGALTPMPGTDGAWIQTFSSGQKKMVTVTNGPKVAKVQLKIFGNPPATIRFDNFAIEVLPQEVIHGKVELDLPFQRGIFSSAPTDFITGKIREISADVKSFTITLKDASGKVRLTRNGEITRPFTAFRIPAPEAVGTENLNITLLNAEGETLASIDTPIIRHAPNPSEVTFRDDGVTLVNGRPFFMIAHWWYTRRGDFDGRTVDFWYNSPEDVAADMRFLREAGFNTVFLGHERFGHIDLAHQNGLMAIVENRRIREKATWQPEVARHRGHPALLAYFGRDEAMVFGVMVDELMAETRMLRAADPYHPLFHNEAPNGTVEEQRAYSIICDVIGRDIYPVGMTRHGHGDLPDKTMTAVGAHTDICMQSVNFNKPVWMILQSLSWGHINTTNRNQPYEAVRSRYPTYAENRFMAFNAIIHGATGIMYHYLGYTIHLPEAYWSSLRKVTLELEYLSPVLVCRTVRDPQLKCSDENIRFLVKNFEGKNYYFIINESAEPKIACFENAPESTLNELFNPIPVIINDGKFTLELPAYGVAVLSEARFKSAEEIFKPSTYTPYSRQTPIRK